MSANLKKLRINNLRPLFCFLLLLVLSFPSTIFGVETLTNEWSIGTTTISQTCPAVGPDGVIYFGTFTGRLWALRPDGSRKWIFRAGLEIKSSPAIGTDGTVYFGSRDRKCYALGANGKELWEFPTGGWVDSSPAITSDGLVCFGSWDKIFYAISLQGRERWRFATSGPIDSSPAVARNGTIFFGSHDNKFYALMPDGKLKWAYGTGGPIISSPAINQEHGVYFTSVDGFFYALDFDGTLKWRLRTGGITEASPVIGPDGTIYIPVNKQLWAITPKGEKKWDRNVEDLIQPTPLVLADSSICFESGWGVMLNVGPDMTFNWIFVGVGHGPPAIGAGGEIYVSDAIHFLAVKNKIPLAKSPWPKFRGNPRNTGNMNDSP